MPILTPPWHDVVVDEFLSEFMDSIGYVRPPDVEFDVRLTLKGVSSESGRGE